MSYDDGTLVDFYVIRIFPESPNLPLKMPQTPINKGRKTSWRLSEPPTNLQPTSLLEVSERSVRGWSNLQLPANALYIGVSEENSWR